MNQPIDINKFVQYLEKEHKNIKDLIINGIVYARYEIIDEFLYLDIVQKTLINEEICALLIEKIEGTEFRRIASLIDPGMRMKQTNYLQIDRFQSLMIQLGFELKTKIQAEKGPVSIRMENVIIPDGVVAPVFYKIKIYQPGNSHYVQFLADEMDVFENF